MKHPLDNQTVDWCDNERPCGQCDIGVYSELACLNKKAREFGALSSQERLNTIPKCKCRNIDCVGAKDFHNMINEIDALYEKQGDTS